MPFNERIDHPVFLENQDAIELQWDPKLGDRKNELVFIGIDYDKQQLRNQLNACLLNDLELEKWRNGNLTLEDNWPV